MKILNYTFKIIDKVKSMVKISKQMEEIKMKPIVILLMALSLVTCLSNADVFAAVSDKTASVAATGTVAASTALTIGVSNMTYGNTAADSFPTVPKIPITFGSNYNAWLIRLYTNNTVVPMYNATANTGKYAKGGLATSDGKNVVPCKWIALSGANATVPSVPQNTVNAALAYNFVKDVRDEDDIATGTYDESWAAAINATTGGYPTIAYGGTSGGWCIDPTKNNVTMPGNSTSTNSTLWYKGQTITNNISLYIGAGWGTSYNIVNGTSVPVPAGAGTYSTTFIVELLHE